MSRMSLHYDFVKQPSLQAQIGPTLSLTRATIATVLAADGYIKHVPATRPRFTGAAWKCNLLPYSRDFSLQDWTTQRVTWAQDGTVAPDGSNDAVLITNDGQTGSSGLNNVLNKTVGSVAYILSCYMKAGTNTWGKIQASTGGEAQFVKGYFDLANGSPGTTNSSGFTDDGIWMQDVGGGWYRCAIAFHSDALNNITATIRIADADNDHNIQGGGTESIYVWGVQLEQSVYGLTAPSDFIATGNTGDNGLPQPAYADTIASHVERKGLLIEEARTNICLQSEDIQTTWGPGGLAQRVANAAIAPDGSLTADEMVESSAAEQHYIVQTISTTGSAVHTFSAFCKANTRDYCALYVTNISQGKFFDLANGAVLGDLVGAPDDAGIEDYGNGWYRCWITVTETTAGEPFRIYLSSDGSSFNYLGDGSSIYVWGMQAEVGPFPTSYIPTTTAPVARNGDAYSTTDTSWINADNDEGTILIGLNQPFDLSQARIFMSYASGTERAWDMLTSTAITTQIYLSGIVEMSVTTAAVTNGADLTYVTRWDSTAPVMNDYLDGVASTPDSTGDPTSTTTSNTTSIGYYGPASTNYFTGHIREIAYWPVALSTTECSTMSAWGLVGAMRSNEITRQHNSVNAVHNKLTRQHRDPTLRHNR